MNPLHISINWAREAINGKLDYTVNRVSDVSITIDVTLTYFTLYFIDNNSDQLIDPMNTQFFLFSCTHQKGIADG